MPLKPLPRSESLLDFYFARRFRTRLALCLHGLIIRRAPQIPARDRTVRPPSLAVFQNQLRLGSVLVPVNVLKALPNSQIMNGQHVGPSKPEHQKHLHGPFADPAHLRRAARGFRSSLMRRSLPRGGTVPSSVFAARSFTAAIFCRESPAPRNFVSSSCKNFLGSRKAARAQRLHASENRGRRLARQLLIDDGLQQARKRMLRFLFLGREAAELANHFRQMPVRRAKVRASLVRRQRDSGS